MSERAVPFYCPYCGDEDLVPYEADGSWHCRACARAFQLKFLAVRAPHTAGTPAADDGAQR
ncbi:hypothetical protein SAMN04489712_103141 [Thermomonospora echinospora]|uniref:Insertion element protein n=1 Tax=Thermomonospora echinospora TaxID=1992 RepID=A0A1H5X9Q7_9ACTN|nr:hypothetical protein [Thermomonospora echinospora]SEG08087.1 hypothetical protein SAMN04489712_103141 [Thermomonospora echinospora]